MADRKMPVKPHANNAVTSQEVEAIRTKVRTILQQAKEKSDSSGKPLLVIVGEDHESGQAAILESLIYQEAKNLGIKDVALELPLNPKSPEAKRARETLPTQELSRRTISACLLSFNQAGHYQHQIHFVDGREDLPFQKAEKFNKKLNANVTDSLKKEYITLKNLIAQDESFLCLNERNETIAANVARIPRPVILMTGSLHVKGLLELMKKHTTHEVVSFNVSASRTLKAEQYAPSTHKFCVDGDTRGLTIDQIAQLALGESSGNAFIKWAETNRHKSTKSDLLEFNKNIEEMLNVEPQNVTLLKEHTVLLYELGRDAEAGKEFAKLLKIHGPNHHPTNLSKFSESFLQALTKEMNTSQTESLIEEISEWWDQLCGSKKTPPAVKDSASRQRPSSNKSISNQR